MQRRFIRFMTMAVAGLVALAVIVGCTTPRVQPGQQSLRLAPPEQQPLSYGGGLEWSFARGDGCQIYVREYGSPANPTWVVVHGGFGAEHSYLLDAFVGLESNYHLVFYDQRGSMRSRCPVEHISIDAHLDDLDVLRQELALDRINIVAHSMGGHLAAAYLAHHAEHVDGVILIAPAMLKQPMSEQEQHLEQSYSENASGLMSRPETQTELQRHGLDAENLGARAGTLAWRVRFAATNLYDVSLWPLIRGGNVYYSAEAGNAASANFGDMVFDYVTPLQAHDRSVTVILGDTDFVDLGGELYGRWFGEHEAVHYTLLEQAGHLPWLDQPERFRTILLDAM